MLLDDKRVYVASRVIPHHVMWKRLRTVGLNIVSTWIDEAGEIETEDFRVLWDRIEREVKSCDVLLFYARQQDFPFKGALVEVGMALAFGKRVICCLPGVELEGRTLRPLGSWLYHPRVERNDRLVDLLKEFYQ